MMATLGQVMVRLSRDGQNCGFCHRIVFGAPSVKAKYTEDSGVVGFVNYDSWVYPVRLDADGDYYVELTGSRHIFTRPLTRRKC